ncbi:MAG: C69 family dipeptidase [Bacteroidales bacterium]|nr:C69 family dipeptidase [Bacteroidales bacterium]MDD4209541.1 C69 family dipeptidase [Bacteroidales bacterium]
MKKIFLSALACIFLISISKVNACTNFLVTKGASKDSSTFISYAADSHTLYGELYHYPAATYPAGTLMDVYEWDSGKKLGQIKQALVTYNVVGNINEHQVAIGETTYGGLDYLQDKRGIVDYGSLIYITLQRAKTAREAIKIFHELVSEYGYCSSGESFSISDPNEVWILEMIGKGKTILDKKGNTDTKNWTISPVWVAMRIPDGYVSGHANQARITTFPLENGKTSISTKNISKIFNPSVEVVYTYDVISYAKSIGLYTGKDADFSFSDTYAPVDFGAARFCDARVWAGFMKLNPEEMAKYEDYARGDNLKNRMPLWIKPNRKLDVKDVFDLMRDHYQGTSMDMTKDVGAGPYACPYRWRPMTWDYKGVDYIHERAISTQQTGFSFIAQCRGNYPNAIGGIIWFGVDDSYTSVYMPMFCGITKIPHYIAVGNGNMMTYSPTSAFWLFNQVSNFAYTRYSDMIKDIQPIQQEMENNFIQMVEQESKRFAEEYLANKQAGINAINNFSNTAAANTFNRWKDLYHFLLVKYIDGNVKKEKDGKFLHNGNNESIPASPDHPRYPDWYYKLIIDDAGENLKAK